MIESIELFPFLDMFFMPPSEFDKISKTMKQKHCYMLKQFLAKGIPDDVLKFGNLDHWSVVDALYHRCRFELKLTRKPQFMYAKGNASAPKSLIQRYSRDALELVIKKFDYEYKTIVELTKKYPELIEPAFIEAETYVSQKLSVKKTKA